MKKRSVHSSRNSHVIVSKNHQNSMQDASASKSEKRSKTKRDGQAFTLLNTISQFIKKKLHKHSEEVTPTQLPEIQGQLPKLELEEELKQLIASQDDAVNKLYRFDLMLRKYYGKEYKIEKRMPYNEMMTQLEEKNIFSAANLLKKIIEYAYSGKPLEKPQMQELLTDFQQLMTADAAKKQAEKETHQKRKKIPENIEQEALAERLMPITPHLPPSMHPFSHLPRIDLQKYRDKLRGIVGILENIRPQRFFARVHLPKSLSNHSTQSVKTPQQHTTLPRVHWPELHLPRFSEITQSKTDVKKSPIKFHELELPKVALPKMSPHESHAPRYKLPSYKKIKQTVISNMTKIHLPRIHKPNIHLPNIPVKHLRKILHLPKFHPGLYYERIKEHLQEIHPSEYIHTVTDHIPRIHPSEYYESLKESVHATWEKIHPPKQSEEELALQVELSQEQAAQETAATSIEKPTFQETPLPKKEKPKTLLPVIVAPEKYWIEYTPRHHAARVEHHFAYEIDDIHHIKSLLKQHHKAGLI